MTLENQEWHHPDAEYRASSFIKHLRLSLWTRRTLVPVLPWQGALCLSCCFQTHLWGCNISTKNLKGIRSLWQINSLINEPLFHKTTGFPIVCFKTWAVVPGLWAGAKLSHAARWTSKMQLNSNMHQWAKQTEGLGTEYSHGPSVQICTCST